MIRRRRSRLGALLVASGLLAAAGCSEGTFGCGESFCELTQQYCVVLYRQDGTTATECVANPCVDEPSCGCAGDDADTLYPDHYCNGCGLTATNGAAYEITVDCEEREPS